MIRNIGLIWIIFCCWGCQHSKRISHDEFLISGTFSDAHQPFISLYELTPEGEVLVDSARIDPQGNFEFKKQKIQAESLFLLRKDRSSRDFITLLPQGEEHIIVTAVYDSFVHTFQVTGSVNSMAILPLQKLAYQNQWLLDSLANEWNMHQSDDNHIQVKENLDQMYYQALKNQKEVQRQLILTHPDNMIAIFALFQCFGSTVVFSQNDHSDFEFMWQTIDQLYQTMPQNPHVKTLHERYEHLHDIKKLQQLEQQTSAIL